MLKRATFLALVWAGQACSSSDQSLEPVRIIRGDPSQEPWFDLTIRGVGLDEHNGRLAVARIGHPDRAPERLGSGEAMISGGTFTLSFPAVNEDGLYKVRVVHIDVDGDGRCEAQKDLVFADFSAPRQPLTLAITGNSSIEPPPSTGLTERMLQSFEDRDCELFLVSWPRE